MALIVKTPALQPRRIRTGAVDPGRPGPTGPVDPPQTAQAETLLEAGTRLARIGLRETAQDRTAALSRALADYRTALDEQRKHLETEPAPAEAGPHNPEARFRKAARAAAQPLAARLSGPFRSAFLRDAAGLELRFVEQGRELEARARAARAQQALEADRAAFRAAAAAEPDNSDFLDFQYSRVRERARLLQPDRNPDDLDAELNAEAAGAVVQGFLDRDDVDRAAEALSRFRELPGVNVPDLEGRIRSRSELLAVQAGAEARRAAARAERERLAGLVDAVLRDADRLPDDEARRTLAATRLAGSTDSLRDRAEAEVRAELDRRALREDAHAGRTLRRLQELARSRNRTPDAVQAETEPLPEAVRERLRLDPDGRSGRETPAGLAALAELRRRLDAGSDRGGLDPDDADGLDAFIFRNNLTFAQARRAAGYAGRSRRGLTQSRADRAVRALFPERDPAAFPDLFDRLEQALIEDGRDPDAAVSDEHIRTALLRLEHEARPEAPRP